MPLLSIRNLGVRYGRIRGTSDVSFDVAEGEIVALIGTNGAGKSSTLKAILGMAQVAEGSITWRGESLQGRRPSEIMRLGIGFSPEGRRVFPSLTVLENLQVGGYAKGRSEVSRRLERVLAYFPRLSERARQQAGNLSGGEQQMLAIGRALMSSPALFLLDEPSLGLAPIVVERIGEILLEIQASEGLAVVVAEQNADWALRLAQRAVVLELGRSSMQGEANALMDDPRVRSAFLGI